MLLIAAGVVLLTLGCVQKPSEIEPTPTITLTQQVQSTQTTNATLMQEKIKSKLIGLEIMYYGKRGEIEKYIVTESDIKMINETLLENKKVWKVRIGEAIAWDYYFDEKGENIVKSEQLFRT